MEITTSNKLAGHSTEKNLGVVAAQGFVGMNLIKDFFAGFTDKLGGRSKSYEEEIKKYRIILLDEMVEEAKNLNANAIIGMRMNFTMVGQANSMIFIHVYGTAVSVKKSFEK